MNKTTRSLLNSITSIMLTVVNGLCNLIVTRKIIEIYGSDFNGINSTATQIINVLLIIEGGFAIAANVALFEPLSSSNQTKVASIYCATKKKFHRIGLIFFAAGILTSFVFALSIKSSLSYEIRFLIFVMLAFSTAFNLFYATRYKVLFQSDQREYIINVITIVTYVLTYIVMYIAVQFRVHMLILRLVVMVFAIINSIAIGVLCKHNYPYIEDKQVEPDFRSIKGTTDVFVQKIVGVVYYSAPIVVISAVVSTAAASVYAVYNTVFTLIRSAENSIINAPRMSLGRLYAEEGSESDRLRDVFNQYEFCTFLSISSMLSVATVMIMPFISVYAKSFTDISYTNWTIALLLILTCYIECIHIPSGNLINMMGRFKEGKRIQLSSGVVLMLTLGMFAFSKNIIGVLIAVLFTAIVLAVLEIGYVRLFVFKHDAVSFWKNLLTSFLTAAVLIYVEMKLNITVYNFFSFLIISGIIFIVNTGLIYIANLFFNKRITVNFTNRIVALIHRK